MAIAMFSLYNNNNAPKFFARGIPYKFVKQDESEAKVIRYDWPEK